MWPWLLQRVTAVILLLGLAVHLFALHIVNLGSLSYDNVAGRLASRASSWSTSPCSGRASSTL